MEPITRTEKLMAGQQLEPITRKELFLAKAAGMDVETPEPITREEMFLNMITGGGADPVTEPITITANGSYEPPEGVDGYNPVTVNVPTGGGGSSPEWFNDGDTHIWISLPEGRTSPYLCITLNGTVTIDWGDGTEPDVISSTPAIKGIPHEYAKAGDYVISMSIDGTLSSAYSNNYSKLLTANGYSSSNANMVYRNAVKRIELGWKFSNIDPYSFAGLYCLSSVRINSEAMVIYDYAFSSCYGLSDVVLSNGVTQISDKAFYYCNGLVSIVITDSVSSIGAGAFNSCYCAKIFDFTACTKVPSLANTDAFTGIPSDCQMLIPSALYDEWSTATNWATYASKMVAV